VHSTDAVFGEAWMDACRVADTSMRLKRYHYARQLYTTIERIITYK